MCNIYSILLDLMQKVSDLSSVYEHVQLQMNPPMCLNATRTRQILKCNFLRL